MQLKAAILSAFLAIAPASAHLRNVHDMNNKNGATTIDDEAALRNHITSWIDELKDSTAANNDSRRLDSDPHCVAVKDSAANILASAMEGCGTAASGSLAGGIATNESPNPTCLLLLCEAHFKAADIVTTECETEGIPRDQILACQLTPGYLPPDDPIANADGATILVNTGAFVDVLDNDEGTFGFNLELRDIVTPANDGLCWLGEILGTGKMGVLYTPNEGFIGQDECVYQVCYAEGTRYADQCDDATVTIDVNAQPTSSPTAAPTFGCDITLELEPHIPLVSQETCEGKLTELTLKYNGGDCTQSNNEQNGKFECEDSNGGPNTEDAVSITVTDKNGVLKLGDGSLAVDVDVSVGDILTLEPPEDETQFESEINIVVKSSQEEIAPANDDKGTGDDVDPDLLQELTIHTSCSQDLRLLDIFGSTQVFAYTDTKKDAPVTVVQPVTVSGGLVNNNGLDIRSTLFELNEEAIDDVPDPIDGDGFSFEETMMTDLSQESLEYTLDFEGTLVELPGQVCDETIDETFTNRNLGLSLTELAASVPDLSILVSLLELTGLDEVLDGPGSFTAFAPTNAAFAALDPDVVDALVAEDPPNTLKGVLLYHVASGDVQSKDLSDGQVIETLKDKDPNTVTVSITDGVIKINDSEVIAADNLASNGVAHIINAVLIPDDFAVPVAIDEAV